MANKMRWRYGETNPVVGLVPATLAVEIGDLVYHETDSVKPASAQPNQTTKALNQSVFAGKFLGVAMQASPLNEATSIRVATTGVFEFECPSKTWNLGDLVGINELPGRTGLHTQQVDTSVLAGAIGRVVRREPVASTVIFVNIKSKIIEGGII
jgi:hypothetical protein